MTREEILWRLLDHFVRVLEELLCGDAKPAQEFMDNFPEHTQDLDPKLVNVLKRGLFLILKSRELLLFKGE